MAPNIAKPPGTPSRRITAMDEKTLQTRIDLLCGEWDLRLDIDDESLSPTSLSRKCIATIKFCFYKSLFDRAYQEFTQKADVIYRGWVHKPRGERGTIPDATRRQRRPVNAEEREQLLQCLFEIFLSYQKDWHRLNGGSPPSIKSKVEQYRKELEQVEKVPISSILSPGPRLNSEKRRREESFTDAPTTKRNSREIIRESNLPPHQSMPSTMAPPGRRSESRNLMSANTSFASTVGTSVFSQKEQDSSSQSSQTTIPDASQPTKDAFTTLQDDKNAPDSSDYQSSSFESRLMGLTEDEIIVAAANPAGPAEQELSQNLSEFDFGQSRFMPDSELSEAQLEAEECFKEKLHGVFPALPRCLSRALPCVVYEVARVFLHADVPISKYNGKVDASLKDYETLWAHLRGLEVLRDKPFPERSSKEAWASALEKYESGFRAVVLAASLHFSPDEDETFFKLKLSPLKLEKSYRLGRRFGHDRFLEICIPQLSGRNIPSALAAMGERGPSIIIEWLVDSTHRFIGRSWKPFMVKDKERPKKQILMVKDVESVDAAFRVFFFAVDGCKDRPKISIPKLLECVRPSQGNEHESYLKLFNRTTLALSRTESTVVLMPDQIKIMAQNITFGDPKNVMNDGAGRMSPSLALKITQTLGLSYLPAAFQGRIGEAKGLWITDLHYTGQDDWIETYPSQRKWVRKKTGDQESDDESHRTFEVSKCSGPLKSADLNLQFLPILMDRAKDKLLMKRVLSDILKHGLQLRVQEIQEARDHPQLFRQWVRDSNPNMKERERGSIGYKAGLPNVLEERLNILLDAGFHPKGIRFMEDLAKKVFTKRIDELKKRLNITVGRSTYAYMVPDFWGVLEEGEVYIDFSSFVDNVSGLSGASPSGSQILVARSPAHFVSDIQKVKAVIREELVGLKDVIIFSVKGYPALADKLSGGDYDGDVAWVCWEPAIVDNFETAEVPKAIDLVARGLIRQDKTTYKDLVRGLSHEDGISLFLKRSFEFNMRQGLLGTCTTFKERVCYAQRSVDTKESRILSQLLSNLVDQPKQGFIFGEDEWAAFKAAEVPMTPAQPLYKTDDPKPGADHIIDYLKWVADETGKRAIGYFYKGKDSDDTRKEKNEISQPPFWDLDLAQYYLKVADEFSGDPQGEKLLSDLKADIQGLKDIWTKKFQKAGNTKRNPNSREDEESVPDFAVFSQDLYEKFRDIRPRQQTSVSRMLMTTPGDNSQLSNWELLKASTAVASFANYKRPYNPSRLYVSSFVWWMAGRQLAKLKAMCDSEATHTVVQSMYIIQKPDASIIKRLKIAGHTSNLEDTASIANEADLEAMDDD
ncbi:uncharacterized protein L3040_001132 [Drepanopeziza brunnea f. sp. 'multigermtubi']|uniref:RNA-dependent RNA polymerase n=1 Tax=Marssonina brunnea f. sp. multigermtubi (strain MB_m1) TaxID=1072389 RepID=K1WUV9_MARBU|nr:uncharacterized protein MBM_05320 [Drepanopeziza brunnea f. sp. 'multigermtubi' MB_m1]EKD16851.1 hypothetical protein MBM_05320 [Drepanopeziza brunnea f. sp. 'multigermtubi' MB_m1]KAJ5054870.1 hypothetical protein L3040_001132 [Drepanopeziza brunnea f. sp. 'multigermtubi']